MISLLLPLASDSVSLFDASFVGVCMLVASVCLISSLFRK